MGNNHRSKGRGNDARARQENNRLIVLNAIVDLNGANRQASRHAISSHTGLSLTVVDDHVKRLKADGLINAPVPGIFEALDQTPDRAVSGTYVTNGKFKLEVGDCILELTPREVLNVARLTGGHALLAGR